ncbi:MULTISPECIES: eCIS core domain-containing protein [unclassified Sphingopyxis]|uniref:eCIS core domain-containing protein n=1 Tax=unclassified Sphingopyxis TaxID=2614943 RepID=UPI0007369F64|nr:MULTISPECIES: DUF4157 domain-containing protein [unclassified Sphingopyxis]KTE34623.1 hypothetical protein ATE62_15935 [Sphingopyxis sp. HIX]KTE80188.1 hypothetical protein ATE72_18135 [Sphingopyxis sp. HXXIV]
MSGLHATAAKRASAKAAPSVMRKSAPPSHHAAPPLASLAAIPATAMVQRECASCEQEEPKESAIQRRLTATAAAPLPQRACAACEAKDEESAVQPRLEVGPAGDRYEQEADSIAAKVMAMPAPDAEATPAGESVQRACGACSSPEEPRARRRADPGGKSGATVRARRDGGAETIAASDADLTRGGSELPAATRGFFESRMGRDLGDVRIHSGSDSAARNASISARAFTYKNHVWLGAGESAAPSFTMAHELAHVMQQTAPGPLGPGSASVSRATIQRLLLPPGNCDQASHDAMQRQVKFWCDHRLGRACSEGDSCGRLRQKIRNNQMCAQSRKRINDICYAGGDAGHRIAERDARRAQANCMALFRAKCERRTRPIPVPERRTVPEERRVPVPENNRTPVPVPNTTPAPVPVPARSTWEIIAEWARQVANSGEDAFAAAERLLAENPGMAGTIVAAGTIAIIALLADDATLVGIADDVLIPIIGALEWVAARVLIFGAPAAAAAAAGGR